jgi:hypothetical protein
MGTKNNPGKFDCYEKAEPNEPMFILLGRDPSAAFLVNLWIAIREQLGCTEPEKLAEAEACAKAMQKWAHDLGKCGKVTKAERAAIRAVYRMMANILDSVSIDCAEDR